MRIIPTTAAGPVLTRVIGSLDYKGSGTNHVLPYVNPFVLLDEAPTIKRRQTPDFGLHPHSGAMILTMCLSGFIENITIDNKDGKEQKKIHGPGPFLVAVNAGRGVVHDEHTSSDDPTKLLQLAWMTGDDQSDVEVQSVDNPIILNEKDGTNIMLCAGTFREKISGIQCKQNPSITVLFVTLPPGGIFETNEFSMSDDNSLFVYNMNKENETGGPITINDTKVAESNVVVLEQQQEQSEQQLKIQNEGTNVVSVLLGYGKRMEPIWKKLLMFNGFIFAKSEEDAEKKYEEFEKVGLAGYGRK